METTPRTARPLPDQAACFLRLLKGTSPAVPTAAAPAALPPESEAGGPTPSAAVSSLLLGDPEVVMEFAGRQRSRPGAARETGATALLAALRGALGADPPRAADFLEAAA